MGAPFNGVEKRVAAQNSKILEADVTSRGFRGGSNPRNKGKTIWAPTVKKYQMGGKKWDSWNKRKGRGMLGVEKGDSGKKFTGE